jgi:hypothetical protein
MNVYLLRADSNRYRGLILTRGDLFEFANRFDGTLMKRPWADVKFGWDPDMLSKPKGDYPSLIPSVPVFSRAAVAALRDLLEGAGEILPVKIAREEYFLHNVTRIVDALDESHSILHRFDDGRVFHDEEHSFFGDKLDGVSIFKVPQMPDLSIFVTDVFVKRVKQAKLKGFWLPLLWSGK